MHFQRKYLLLSTTVLAAAAAVPAHADTTLSADSSQALSTSTAGDITIAAEVELDVNRADPLTIDSDAAIVIEEDALVEADGRDGRNGILVTNGSGFSIENAGIIHVIEKFVPEDEDSNSIPDGAIAEAQGRSGILVQSGSGTFDNSGEILVEGLNSHGINFAQDFTGSFTNTGTISVIGDNSVGLEAQSFDGDLALGDISVVGEGTRAVVINGDISGTLAFTGDVGRAVTYTDDDDNSLTLSRSDLRTYAPAVTVSGNVDGGILVDARPYELDSTDDDEDNDGVTDSEEPTGTISTYGESPALLIGSADDVVIGSVKGRDGTYSLAIDGSVTGSGYYSTFDVNTVVIGGEGGTVSLADGIGVSGTVSAATTDSTATAITINEGVFVPVLNNSGTITASIRSTGEGHAFAIKDLSGTLETIRNTGYITASGSQEDETVAIDLGANTSGVKIIQRLNAMDAETKADEEADEDYDASNPTYYAVIRGDIVTGSGDDVIDVRTGYIAGDSYLGDGNDRVKLSDDSLYVGDIHSESGSFRMSITDTASFVGTLDAAGNAAQVTISDEASFTGNVANGDQLTINVNGGVLTAEADEVMEFDTLIVGADGAIGIVIDGEDSSSSSFAVNQATFADGSAVHATINTISDAEGTYTVLNADQMSGSPSLELTAGDIPILFDGALDVGTNSIELEIRRKTAEELGLTTPQSDALSALVAMADVDSYIEASLLQVEDVAALQSQFDGLLPDYAGGTFDFVTRGSRLAAKHVSDDGAVFDISPVGMWVEGLYFRGSKDYTESAGFKTKGMGISGGLERDLGFGYVGASLSYAWGDVGNGDLQSIDSSTLEIAGHWRVKSGPFYAFARASFINANFSSTRNFAGIIDDEEFTYTTTSDWGGKAFTGMLGASYNVDLTQDFTLRPKAVLYYFNLSEDGHEEDNDLAIDLTVADRTSKVLSATTSAVASYRFGQKTPDFIPLTLEVEAGYRSILDGSIGSTTAYFEDGDSFTLTPDELKGGWTTEARVLAGGMDFQWQVGIGAEQTQGDIDLSARVSLSAAF